MEVLTEAEPAVWRIFGREPSIEDWRCVGRWAYAAAWVAEDRETAREIVRSRFVGAAAIATQAAMGAGRGGAERHVLVSAIAQLTEGFKAGRGPLGATCEQAIEEAATKILQDGAAMQAQTRRERAAFAPKVDLAAFETTMREVGPDRHIVLREVASELDEALAEAKTDCPALRTLRLFLAATLCLDPYDAAGLLERAPAGRGTDAIATMGAWLTADLALAARRSTAYEAAWTAAVRISSDALSRTLTGLTKGAMLTNNVTSALAEDPWALVLTLAMTTEAEHASALLDCAAQAQVERRTLVAGEAAKWSEQALKVAAIERRLEIEIKTSSEARDGFREYESLKGVDLFSLWNALRKTEASRQALTDATEECIAAEAKVRREAVRKGKEGLETVRQAYDAVLDAAKAAHGRRMEAEAASFQEKVGDGSAAQQASVYGFGTGCSVVVAYTIAGVIVGTGGLIGKLGPLVMGVAALPVAAAISVQIAYAIKRSAAMSESNVRRSAATEELDQARALAEREHGAALSERRRVLEDAEAKLGTFERLMATNLRRAS